MVKKTREQIPAVLAELLDRYRGLREGTLPDYIPELATADPNRFGIAVATADGEVFEAGDADEAFSIQSVSKPFVYGRALERFGREAVLRHVGVEPTGDAFNSIIKLDAANRPHNPCVNAGAIATTSMLAQGDPSVALSEMLDMFSAFAGRRVSVDVSVFVSERMSGHRNRAIAHLMLNFGMIEPNVDQILDLYFQQCSINVTCRDLAVMAGTLANGGINPVTGARAILPKYLRDVLTVMYTCGMYDYAGEWAYTVGLPAKSGISGGIIAVVPGRFGIAAFSPLLDERGHSIRGIRVCEDLSREFGMHMFGESVVGPSAVEDPGVFERQDDTQPDEFDGARGVDGGAYVPDRGRAPVDPEADERPDSSESP